MPSPKRYKIGPDGMAIEPMTAAQEAAAYTYAKRKKAAAKTRPVKKKATRRVGWKSDSNEARRQRKLQDAIS